MKLQKQKKYIKIMTVFCFYSPQHQTTSALLSPSFCMSLSHALLSTCLSLPMGRTGCPIPPQPVLWLEGSEEATTDPPWCSTTAAFAAVPGLAEECPQEPISRPLPHPIPIPPAPPTDGAQKEAVPVCPAISYTLVIWSSLDTHPLACLPPELKCMHFPTSGKRVLGVSMSLRSK